ncbi:MAG: hypothetical protein ACREUE_08400 [Panacagrimonas sp.]
MTRASNLHGLVLGLTTCSLIAGCSTMSLGQRPPLPNGEQCLALYAKVDAQIEAAGVRDAGYHRIPGFPYLRSDRYSASFAREIPNNDAFWEWVGYLRANEDEAREVELINLKLGGEQAWAVLNDMRSCGGWLRSWELDDPAFRQKMIDAVRFPDDYSTTQRVLGMYPLAVPFLEQDLSEFRASVESDFAAPLAAPAAPGELLLWKAQANPNPEYAAGTIDLRSKPRDLLGRPGMVWSEIVHLAHTHAPALWIESTGDHDRPGMPVITAQGPQVDSARPVLYYLTGLTRFGGRSLLQISYFAWFSGDDKSGALDGLIWRITLDEQGRPLVHDTIHASGGAHYAFPAQPLQRREPESDSILFPQKEGAPAGAIAVRVRGGPHTVTRVVPVAQAGSTPAREYELRSYEELLMLPDPAGGTRSLFGPEGFIAGSRRSENFWRWPSGVRHPGAVRQWGHHPTALVGRAHFDDPFLFEQAFIAPDPSPPVVGASSASNTSN